MNSVLTKTLVVICMLAVIAAAPSTSDAGIIPWVYNAIFGPSSGPNYGGYNGARYYPAPTYSGYGPTYAPMSMPGSCSTNYGWNARVSYYVPCSPCATSPCAIGQCAVNSAVTSSSATSGKQPTVADDPPTTFAKQEDKTSPGFEATDAKKNGEGTDDVSAPGEKFFEPNELGKEHKVEKRADTKTADDADGKSATSNTNVKKQTAPTTKTIDEDDAKNDAKPATPKKEGGSSSLTFPPVDLERKVTWRVVPKRTRLAIRANVDTAVVARQKVRLNVDWVAVQSDTRLVSK